MTYCEGCQQLEGDTITAEDGKTCLCANCHEPVTQVPEHDSMEER